MLIFLPRFTRRHSRSLRCITLIGACVMGVACSETTAPDAEPPLLAYQTIAYQTINGSLVSIPSLQVFDPVTGSVVEQIVMPHGAAYATVSPDGKQIAFVLYHDLSVMNRDGSGLHSIYTDISLTSPSWSPDGQEIAFTDRFGNALRRISASGGTPTTISSKFVGYFGVWAPSGTELVVGGVPVDRSNLQLALVSRDGAAARFLTPPPAETYDLESPAWSPDGQHIAFTAWLGSDTVYVMTISRDGSGLRQITTGFERSDDPVWSADGTQIFFAGVRNSSVPGSYSDVFAIDVGSGQLRQVTHTPTIPKGNLMRIAR